MTATTDRVLAAAPVLDGHNDLLWTLRERCGYDFDHTDLAVEQSGSGLHTDLPRLRAGGVGGQFWSVWVPCSEPHPVTATLEQIDAADAMIRRYPAELAFATTADEVERAMAAGRVASLLGAEGGHQIGNSLGTLRMLHRLGVRYLTLTHNENTDWADSATDEPVHGGLTDFGRNVVREMNRLGMLVDLSHVSAESMHAALDVSTAPAFFSHSSARALCSHPRNVPDDVLARVGATDGVVMVTFVPGFLTEECHAWMDAMTAEEARLGATDPGVGAADRGDIKPWLDANPRPPCTVADVADHVEHVREVAGVRAVGLGGDFDGIVATPDGLPDVSGYPALLAELAGRGWSESELAGLTSRNALRVVRETLSAAEGR
ncbi:dipeptidase [Actinocatenispora thailandica]|uniref:Dipeptidase n=1 Tax=Actinocatenispora thailandica TaxID=227318 RepID=A0A7R7DJR8_9ACTN|nr:dipeptidase [Actinocatenispora thailandica]BCJ32810.1 dipeptidase [Actinocatenispora thailandica]